MFNQHTHIKFRTDSNGNLVEVTEQNTKITYTKIKEFSIGRLVFTIELISIKSTIKARIAYFKYNNAVARMRRTLPAAIFSRFQRLMGLLGFNVHMTY